MSQDKDILLTLRQTRDVYDIVDNMIEFMDEPALAELYSGNADDVDTMIETLVSTTKEVIHGEDLSLIKPENFGYLDRFSAEVTETLRCRSFNYFILDVLPNFILGWHNIQWGNLTQIYRTMIILAARDHSKSYTFSYAYVLWQLYRYKHGQGVPKELKMAKEGLLITNEKSLSIHFLSLVKDEIESNDILGERLLPDSKQNNWGKESIMTKQKSSVFVRSATSKMRGRHPSWIVCDDLLNDSSLYSQDQRDKYWNVFSGVIVPMLEPDGQLLMIGTPYSDNDLYSTIRNKKNISVQEKGEAKRSFNFPVFEYPAIFPTGELLFPQRHSFDSLMEKKELLGQLIFSREILVKPISDGASIFPYSELKKSIKGQGEIDCLRNRSQVDENQIVKIGVGVDFAISGAIGADYTVFTIGGLDKYGVIHVFNSVRIKGASYQKQISVAKKINRDFKPDIMYAEDNGFQDIFVQMMQDADLPVVGTTTTASNKKSLYKGLPRLAAFFESHKIKFPYATEAARDMTDLYLSELNSITFIPDTGKLESTNQHDDTSCALWNLAKALKGEDLNFDFNFL